MSTQVVPDVKTRRRKIDVESMTQEQLDSLMSSIGVKIGELLNKCKNECDAYLNSVGLELVLVYSVTKIGEDFQKLEAKQVEPGQSAVITEEKKAVKKRGRPKKKTETNA